MIELANKIFSSREFNELRNSAGKDCFLTGVSGSFNAFIVSHLYLNSNRKIVYCSAEAQKLFKLKDDLNFIIGDEAASVYLDKFDEEYEGDITPLSTTLKRLSTDDGYIILLDPPVFHKPIIGESAFKSKIINIKKGDALNFDELISRLRVFNFARKQVVEEENDYAVRGGILDIFPENLSQPVRIEFYGNIIESIREFDAGTQRSIAQIDAVEILPSLDEFENIPSETAKLMDYIGKDALLLLDEPDLIKNDHEDIFQELLKFPTSFFSGFSLNKSESVQGLNAIREIVFNSKPQPPFNSNTKLLFENLEGLARKSYQIYITCTDDYQSKRFKELVDDHDEDGALADIIYLDNSFHEGFLLPEENIAVYTEHGIYDRFYRTAKRKRRFAGITFKDLGKVNNGDFMVHRDFGIGKYAGMRKVKTGGIEHEAVKLLYKDNDVVFVNLNSLHLIKKYSAQEGYVPKLNKLGGYEWEKTKQRTKKKIQDIARDLILLYSKRKKQKGFRFSADSVWQKELEASFIYEDTPDQVTATKEVKSDMEAEIPMDRLVCGDVGFGKTEVAVRAAFKCVLDNKQAAVLVPTTILAEQHYNTFKDRLSNWAVEVEHISRFKSRKEQTEVLKRLEDGKLNIIIGTHRLLSKDVKFRDLGLLIIDEEQRFGVKSKEKLKFMRENVDVLTLTATPIPRTLNFSLLGARDLSIINTPPKNRQPIHTEIINFDKKTIGNAVLRELQRGGQVYLVNDRIAKLEELAFMIEELVPFAKVAIAHGQMTAPQLEKVMMKFLEKKFNVLVCTKIIESGLDIPTVNTIIINRADHFGLAELYQLRGRVGRSNTKSYAFLITPPQSVLTKQAVRRLHALEEFSDLGSGMNLALRDLEIRGAGNLLGGEQSGFISEMGFDMYMQILDEAVTELKESELGMALTDIIPKAPASKKKIKEVTIESDVAMLIPDYYVDDENTRLEVYQRLANVTSLEELDSIKAELLDRFGKFPDETTSLFDHITIKVLCGEKGFSKISIHANILELHMNPDNEEIFTSGYFEKLVNFISNPPFSSQRGAGGFTSQLVQTKFSLYVKFRLPLADHSLQKLDEVMKIVEELHRL